VKPIQFRRHVAGLAVACLLLAACTDPDVRVPASDFGEEDTAYYLVLSDQLQRVRNILDEPATVCAAVELHDGMAPVPPLILERLASEQEGNEVPLSVVSTSECLVHYTRDKGPFTPERTDVLVLVRRENYATCGKSFGGMTNQRNLNRGGYYNVEVEQGVAHLTGGGTCGALRWYRS
jgi:hypothetical protein